MDGARDQFLSGPTFTSDKDRGVRCGNAPSHGLDFLHQRMVTNEQRRHGGKWHNV
jgi:hypothetical protein